MNQKLKSILICITGVFISGFGVSLFRVSGLGVDPFITFITGINQLITINFGTLYTGVNILLLCFSLVFNKKLIGLATFINLFLFGYIIDFSYELIIGLFPIISISGQLLFLVAGVLLLAFGSSLYFASDLGVSTYDTVGLIISNTWKLAPFKYARMSSDFVFVFLGALLFLLSGNPLSELLKIVNIGTLVTIFCMGPFIDFFITNISSKLIQTRQ